MIKKDKPEETHNDNLYQETEQIFIISPHIFVENTTKKDKSEETYDAGCLVFLVIFLVLTYFGIRELLIIYVTSC